MSTTKITIARDFSEYPAGRYRDDGDFSGQVFRDDILIPKLRQFELIEINLDGAMGYGSSFLEEAFGGLVRLKGFTKEILHQKLKFQYTEDPIVIDEIWSYIDSAHA